MTNQGHKYLNQALFYFFALFIFSSTFSIALAQISLGISLILFLVLAAVTRYNPFASSLKWLYLFIALYIFWMLLSALVGSTPFRSVWIIKEEWLFCVIPIGVFLFGRAAYRNRLLAVFAAGVMLVSMYGIIQHFTGIHWFKATQPAMAPDFGYLVRGNFSHSLTFGNYYGTATLFLAGYALAGHRHLTKPGRLFIIFSSLLSMIATVLSYSRGAIAGLAIALVILGLFVGRRFLVFSLGAIAVAAATILITMPGLTARFSGKTGTDFGGVYEGGRVFIWKHSLKVIQDSPVFGVGQGNFKAVYSSYLRSDIPEVRKHAHAHNDLLNIAAISGIPGALFFAGMWLAAICYLWKGWRKRRHGQYEGGFFIAALAGSIVFFISSLFEATFADEEVRQMLMFVWAAGLWPWYKGTNQEETTMVKST